MEKGNVHIHTNESFSFDELEIGKSADRSSLSGRGTSTNTPVSQKLALSISHKSSLVDANGIDTAFEFALIGPDCSPVPGCQLENVAALSTTGAPLINSLLDNGYTLAFRKPRGKALNHNLKLMDSLAPQIIAALLYIRCARKLQLTTSINELIEILASDEEAEKHPFVLELGDTPQERIDENSYLRERWSQTREHPRFLFT